MFVHVWWHSSELRLKSPIGLALLTVWCFLVLFKLSLLNPSVLTKYCSSVFHSHLYGSFIFHWISLKWEKTTWWDNKQQSFCLNFPMLHHFFPHLCQVLVMPSPWTHIVVIFLNQCESNHHEVKNSPSLAFITKEKVLPGVILKQEVVEKSPVTP